MNSMWQILVSATLITLPPAALWAADEAQDEDSVYQVAESYDDYVADQSSHFSGLVPQVAGRFGWWGIGVDGSKTKIGEYQSLESSPFFDVDGLTSDGTSTLDFHATGTDNESMDVGVRYFRPGIDSKIRYQRFLHRLDHDPYEGIRTDNSGTAWMGPVQDFNAGEDYAIRVNTLKADFDGKIAENVKWHVNFWGMRKFGERQGRAMQHSCADRQCHIQGQRQTIDWLTMEVEPGLTVKLGATTIEYSRTMRAFQQSDGLATRTYTGGFPQVINGGLDAPYGLTSDNYTAIDRIKIGSELNEDTSFYGQFYIGDTKNYYRDIHRNFGGLDARLTNTSIDRVKLTAYGKYYKSNNQTPVQFPEGDPAQGGNGLFNQADLTNTLHTLVDREIVTGGLNARWRPFDRCDFWGRTTLRGGYEYRSIDRANVSYDVQNAVFNQPNTEMHKLFLDTSVNLTSSVQSFARYTHRQTRNPLLGVRENVVVDGTTPLTEALSTNLPEHENLIEVGGSWTPNAQVGVNGTIGILMRGNRSDETRFAEDDYPVTLSAWCAPTDQWTIHGGWAYYANFIDQDGTLGTNAGVDTINIVNLDYGGQASFINLGTTYAVTDRLSFTGLIEFSRSTAQFRDFSDAAAAPPLDVPLIPYLSNVLVEQTRFHFGCDYMLNDCINCYVRYNFFDWNDEGDDYNSGTANMILGGFAAVY